MLWLHISLNFLVVDLFLVLLKPSLADKVGRGACICIPTLLALFLELYELPTLFYQIVYLSFHLKFIILIRSNIITLSTIILIYLLVDFRTSYTNNLFTNASMGFWGFG